MTTRPDVLEPDARTGTDVAIEENRLAARDVLLLFVTVASLVAWSMSSFIRLASADSLLFSLMSTQRLTFFYWGQDRLANVVPLLASPIGDERANFYVQMAVMGASFFVLIMLLARFHATESDRSLSSRSIAGTTLIAGLVVTALLDPVAGYRFVFEQQYVLTIVLYLIGARLIVGDTTWPRFAGGLMVMTSVVVIPSSILLLPFVWFLVAVGPGRLRRILLAAVVTVASFVVVSIAASAFYNGPSQSSEYNDFSVARLRRGLPVVLDNIAGSVRIVPAVGVLVAAVLALIVRRQYLPKHLRVAYASAIVFAVGWTLAFSANGWVETNLFGFRYFFPVYGAIIFVITGGAAECLLAIKPVLERTDRCAWFGSEGRRHVVVLAAAIVILLVGGQRLRADGGIIVLEDVADDARAVDELDVEAVVGGYWRVWPTVFAARANGADVVGITYRAEAIQDEVRDVLGRVDSEDWPVVQILCADVGEDECLGLVGQFTGQVWTTAEVLSVVPLLISAEPSSRLLPRGLELDGLTRSGYSIRASLLPGVVGVVDGDARAADPESDDAGFLSYGPFARLEAAEYLASFTYASDAPIGQVDGLFDVAVDGVMIAGMEVAGTAGRQETVQVQFSGDGGGDFEFRSLWAGDFGLTIDAIKIERAVG